MDGTGGARSTVGRPAPGAAHSTASTRLREQLIADLAVNWSHRGADRSPSGWCDIAGALVDVRFLPVVLVRLTACAERATPARRAVSRLTSLLNRFVFGVEVAAQTVIGPGLYFPHTGGIVIGAATIGSRCTIYHQVTLGAKSIDMPFNRHLRPSVGDRVTIAAGAKVLGGVDVGDGATVGANAVVTHNVPADTRVGGVPARPLEEHDHATP